MTIDMIIYWRPNTDYQCIPDNFKNILSTVSTEGKGWYFPWYYNINLLNYNNNPSVAKFVSTCHSEVIFNAIMIPTATVIDHICQRNIEITCIVVLFRQR